MLAALNKAKIKTSPLIPNLANDYTGQTVVKIPAGDFTVRELNGFLGRENMSMKIFGLKFVGAGLGLTKIIFDPTDTAANVMLKNDYWLGLTFEGITFLTKKAGAIWMESHTTHNAQRYHFTDCEWKGPWKWVIDLQGDNNNSEFSFITCGTSNMQADGAFLRIGATNTSDQFLNYWFFGFKHWSTSAALIDAARGGHFHGIGVDVSDYGAAATATNPAYLFKLRGQNHSAGVQALTMHALRVEAKHANSALLYSEWASGNVNIECDWSSQTPFFTYGDIIYIDLGNTSGPIYNFHDSNLAGGIRIKYSTNAWQAQHHIEVSKSFWHQKLTPTEVVSYDRTSAGGNAIDPQVIFNGVKPAAQTDVFSATGAAVWDATVSWNNGDLVKPLTKRTLNIHWPSGQLSDIFTNGMKIALPLGALITAMTATAPAGNVTEGDGASWIIATTEASPATVATVTVPGSRAAGYSIRTDLAIPYLCNTREKATISYRSTGASQGGSHAIVTIEGYW